MRIIFPGKKKKRDMQSKYNIKWETIASKGVLHDPPRKEAMHMLGARNQS